ncbi:hypothetical protein GGI12_001592 [Dipsacomyces acuminosporus]|nr:hypothetical protein GGI12_001592 [Dipsacomyces acuminosporus]
MSGTNSTSVARMPKVQTVVTDKTVPVTVFTGFLGAGKTTIILNLLKRVSPDYNIVLLKNEFGDAETDSALVRESHIQVTEMTNGCLCCVLVGQMKRALEEMKERYHPDRIIVETSGSAFPAPIAWQIREMEGDGFHLDAILTVVDCINFCGYEDVSYTARMQAQYTDLIILSKWEEVDERKLDIVLDHVNELNTDTPKVKADKHKGIDPELVFGLDTGLFKLSERPPVNAGRVAGGDADASEHDHHEGEVDLVEIRRSMAATSASPELFDPVGLIDFLKTLPVDDIYRVKGLVRLSAKVPDHIDSDAQPAAHGCSAKGYLYILNHAFGRYTFTPLTQSTQGLEDTLAKITVMGNGLRMYMPAIQRGFCAAESELTTRWAVRR